MLLTPRDNEILSTLARKVRMLSLTQFAAAWWNPTAAGQGNARRRLAILVKARLLRLLHVYARPLPEMNSPVATWTPEIPPPDCAAVAWKLQARWTKLPRRTTVFIVTSKAAHQYGGRLRGAIKQELQATHDLGVAEIYLRLLRTAPETAAEWIGEDLLRPALRRRKVPDAVLAGSPRQRPRLVIEFGGAYDARRVADFHRDCAARRLPYEIW